MITRAKYGDLDSRTKNAMTVYKFDDTAVKLANLQELVSPVALFKFSLLFQLLEANLAHVCQCYDVTPAKLLKMGGTTTVPSANGI